VSAPGKTLPERPTPRAEKPSLDGRIAVVNQRRPQVLAILLTALLAGRVLGVAVPLLVYVLVCGWLAAAVLFRSVLRTRDAGQLSSVHAIWLCLDATFITVFLHFVGAGWWTGPALFALVTLAAGVSLPRREAISVGLFASLALVLLVVLHAPSGAGEYRLAPTPALEHTYIVALVTAGLCGGMLLILVARQETLLYAVKRSEERYRLVVETSSHIIVTIAPSGLITSLNAATLDDSGYTREDLMGRPFADFVSMEDLPVAGAFVARAFRGEETKFTLRFLRKSGEARWLEGTVSPIRERNVVTGVLGICRDVTEERSATNRLRATDQRFRTIVDTSFEGIWTVDRHCRTDYVNRRLADMLGYTVEEMLGQDPVVFAPLVGAHPTSWAASEQLDGGGVLEINLRRKDGSAIWAIVSASQLTDGSGAFGGALAMVTDISHQKRVEQDLRDASDHLAAIIETQYEIASADLDVPRVMELIVQRTQTLTGGSGAAIEIVEPGDELVYKAAIGVGAPLLGIRRPVGGSISGRCVRSGELISCADTDQDPQVDRDLARRTGVRAMIAVPLLYERQVIGVLEQFATTPNFFTERDCDTLKLMAGVLAAALGHAKEFEEKKKLIAARTDAMTALQASQERLRTAFECSAVGMTLTDAKGKLMQANRALSEMLGYTPEELTHVNFQDITHPDDRDTSLAAMRRLMRGEISSFQMEKRYLRKDGVPVWTLLGVAVAQDADGFPAHFVSQMVDITQRKRVESERENLQIQLAQSSKMQAVGQLVSGVAHELNNPLAAILGFSEILLQDCKDPETRESLNIIFGQAQRSRAIVRDLLSFVRTREGRQRAPTDMHEMLDRVTRALMPATLATGATLEADLSEPCPTMTVDRAGLEQVFTNLVMNAAQAASSGVVRISARTVGDRLEIAVEDSGPGIPADVFPHIFEPFFTTKPVGQGTGLGLSVSLGIVEQHGGSLRAENRSAADGGGARFVVSLPLESVEPSDADSVIQGGLMLSPRRTPHAMAVIREARVASARPFERYPTPVADTARKPHVLLIDDETPIRNALRRFFERRGWVVEEAPDGGRGLETLLSHDVGYFDAMVCDLKMPGVSGMQLYATLATERPALLDRLIFATGDVASPDAAAFLLETRCPVLEKPYELSLLAATVDRVRGVVAPVVPPVAATGTR
jgi:PAS domain S-box-containing protein